MLIDGASMANAQIVDAPTCGLRIVAHSGFPPEFLDFLELVGHTSDSACGDALANARAVSVADTARSPIFAGSPALEVMLDAGSCVLGDRVPARPQAPIDLARRLGRRGP